MRPARSCERAGRNFRGRIDYPGVARHRLENRHIRPIPCFKGGAFLTGEIKSAAPKKSKLPHALFQNPTPPSKTLPVFKHLTVLASPKLHASDNRVKQKF